MRLRNNSAQSGFNEVLSGLVVNDWFRLGLRDSAPR
jgi:hypothetical protein